MRPEKSTFLLFYILISCTGSDDYLPPSHNNSEFGFDDSGSTYEDNPFITVADQPTSTFSVDADGASYANLRRYIMEENSIPPKEAIRIEEMINYFDLDYPYIENEHPIWVEGEVSSCPWNDENKLIRIGIEGKPLTNRPASNYVFLLDVSGSMSSEDKLDLLKDGFVSMLDEMLPSDRVAIVTYASSTKRVLNSTEVIEKAKIIEAIHSLGSGGNTAGADGINTAYKIAISNFIEGGNNRVIIGTDGDFNVGTSSTEELIHLVEGWRKNDIYLTVIGVGRENLQDNMLEQIANKGNGTYEYVDNTEQLKKVFIYDFDKFFTVAKDVKVQVTFNPINVESYRLIGYENRVLSNDDFNNDQEDAGEIGADQNITALYEIVPATSTYLKSEPTFQFDFRYKNPSDSASHLIEIPIFDQGVSFSNSSDQMKFVSSLACFGMVLRDSPYKEESTIDDALSWIESSNLKDDHNFKAELKDMMLKYRDIQ